MKSYALPQGALTVWTYAVLVFLLSPLVVVVLVSITTTEYISLPTGGVTLRWYAEILDRPEFLKATVNSLVLAFAAAATALVAGSLAAVAVARYSFAFREVVQVSVMSPLYIPMVMGGLAILMFFAVVGWNNAPVRMYVAHSALALPYVFRVVTASLAAFDLNQELAARNLGAPPWRAFMLVSLPQLAPGLFAGAVFAFVVSFDNVGISIFLTSAQYSTLPVQLFNYTTYHYDPLAASVSVIMVVLSVIAIVALERIFGLQNLMR